jgi:hypothetical protein
MAIPFTDNNGSTFYNINNCRSFNQSISETQLTSLTSYPCSEVIIINKTGQSVYIYDSGFTADSNRLLLDPDETTTVRGITNSAQVSAKTSSGSGLLYYRTQYFSMLPQR